MLVYWGLYATLSTNARVQGRLGKWRFRGLQGLQLWGWGWDSCWEPSANFPNPRGTKKMQASEALESIEIGQILQESKVA